MTPLQTEAESALTPCLEPLAASLAAELATSLGWDAHLEAHGAFRSHLELLYELADDPLATFVVGLLLERHLRAHIAFEEAEVLPCLEARAAAGAVGNLDNYPRDHRMIVGALEALVELALECLGKPVDACLLRHRVVVLDRLLEHHDEREQSLYGELGRSLSPAKQSHILREFAATQLGPAPSASYRASFAEHPLVSWLVARYGRWLALRERSASLPDQKHESAAMALPSGLPVKLRLQIERDQRLIDNYSEADIATRRAQAIAAWKVDRTLRSTMKNVFEALVHASVRAG